MSLFWRLAKERVVVQARQIKSLTGFFFSCFQIIFFKGRRILPFPHNLKQLTTCMVCDNWAQDLSQNTVSSVVGKDSPSEEVERPPVEPWTERNLRLLRMRKIVDPPKNNRAQ